MTKYREVILVCKDCGYEKRIYRVVSMYVPPRSADDKPEDEERGHEAKSIRDRSVSPDECHTCKSKSLTTRPFGQEDYEKKWQRYRPFLERFWDSKKWRDESKEG